MVLVSDLGKYFKAMGRPLSEEEWARAKDNGKIITAGFKERKKTIATIKDIIPKLKGLLKGERAWNRAGNWASLAGNMAGVGAGVATIATAGAATPALVAYISWTGCTLSLGGSAIKIINTVNASNKEGKVMEELLAAIAMDAAMGSRVEEAFNQCPRERVSTTGTVKKNATSFVHAGITISGTWGGETLKPFIVPLSSLVPQDDEFLQKLIAMGVASVPKIATCCASKALVDGAKTRAEKIAAKAVNGMVNGPSRRYVYHAAKNAAEDALKEGAENALMNAAGKATVDLTEEVAREFAEDVMGEIAENILKEMAEEVTERAFKEATEKAALPVRGMPRTGSAGA